MCAQYLLEFPSKGMVDGLDGHCNFNLENFIYNYGKIIV